MSKEKQLIKNTAIVSIGKIATQLITFLLLPLYTNMLTTEEYGIVDLLNSIVVFLLPLITLHMEQAVFRFLLDKRDNIEEKKKIITSNFFMLLVQFIIFIVLYIFLQGFIQNEYKIFLVLNIFAHMFSAEMLQISRGLGSNKDYAMSSFIISFVNVVLNILLIAVFHIGAYGLLIANFVSNCLGGIYIVISQKVYKYVEFKYFNIKILKEMLKYSIPLIPNSLSWWVLNVSDRLLVSFFLGVGMNGIYTAANKFSAAYITVFSIFNITWTESVALAIDSQDRESYINKVINIIFILFATMCLGLLAIMPFVFPILVGEKFAEAYNQIPILMLSSLIYVMTSAVATIYIAKKMSKNLAKTTAISAVINIITNILLIKYIGLYAASISTLISYTVTFLYRYFDIRRFIKIKYDIKKILFVFIACIFIFITYYLNIFIVNIFALIIMIIFCLFINKQNFKFVMGIIKKKINKK